MPSTMNKYGLHLHWPRLWIILIGVILLFLCFCIAGMEVGHTIFDLRRSTAFGGFIVFLPLLICAIVVLVTACKPTLTLLRVAVVLCFLMIILLMVLIAYDILVLIDPTRCFFLNCNEAFVYQWNSTANTSYSGWPLYFNWPSYFQTNMNAKRIFQSIQILCAVLFILFAALYILTFFIYRYIRLVQQPLLTNLERHQENNRATPVRYTHRQASPTHPTVYPHQKVITYMIEGRIQPGTGLLLSPATTVTHGTVTSKKTKEVPIRRPRASSLSYDRLCTRCNKEPRLILRTRYERENFFGNLCVNCNNDLLNNRPRPPPVNGNRTPRVWRP